MRRLERAKQIYETFAGKHPYAATLGEAAVFFAAKYGVQRLDLPIGHGRKDRPSRRNFIENHPAIATGLVTAVAPVAGELVFRELPARMMEKRGIELESNLAKRVKLGVAAVFAASHAGPDAIPVTHFVSGLNYSRLHERRGLSHSIMAHAANNTMAA